MKYFCGLTKIRYGTVAQSVEQRTFNPLVEGSNPSGPTSEFLTRSNVGTEL